MPHALATHGSCDQLVHAGRVLKERGTLSLMTFAALLVTQKREKRKVSLSLFAGERCSPLPHNLKAPSTAKTKDLCLSAFSFAYTGAKEKAGAKKRRMPAAFHYSFFSPVFTIGSSSVSSEADCVFSPDATASAAFFGGTIVRFSSPRSVQVLNIASFAHPGPISS